MDKNDYRNTTYCPELVDVERKKEELKQVIRVNGHPTTNNFYEIIRDEYKREYLKIYNYKCSYCGVSVLTTGYHMFEIDHYKNKASYPTITAAGKMDNLVVSCYTCNRSKGEMKIASEYIDKLQPDKVEIRNFFYRDDDYSIKIATDYQSDLEIIKFYKTKTVFRNINTVFLF